MLAIVGSFIDHTKSSSSIEVPPYNEAETVVLLPGVSSTTVKLE